MSHSNRSQQNRSLGQTPSGAEVQAARLKAKMTEEDAARVIRGTATAWKAYETGAKRMHPGLMELFLLKTGQLEQVPA